MNEEVSKTLNVTFSKMADMNNCEFAGITINMRFIWTRIYKFLTESSSSFKLFPTKRL